MRVGLSLPPGYLVGDPQAGQASAAWHETFGCAGSFLELLRRAGVTSVELRSVAGDAKPDVALGAAQRIWDAGMGLTVHGKLPQPICGETFSGIYPSLVPVTKALHERGARSILTLHCYSAKDGHVQELAARTVGALRKMLGVFLVDHVPLRIALEINHVSARQDPGVTYAGILDMIAAVDDSQLGACWDFGHAVMNVQNGQLAEEPSDDFLKRVIHTHVHDLGPRTHFPLTHGVVPVDRFLDLLFMHGYPGIVNLELSPERFRGSAHQGVWKSIERLVAYGRHREWSPQ